MKKFLFLICALCVCLPVFGKTTNWYVDGSVYRTTTCSSGDDVTPPTPPTKYGYTFMGWKNTALIRGTWSQSGTPTPDNPIYPTFYQNGDLILRAVGTGNNIIQDVYNQDTGKITRNVGIKVLDGTENWTTPGDSGTNTWRFRIDFSTTTTGAENSLCTHIGEIIQNSEAFQNIRPCIRIPLTGAALLWYSADNTQTLADFKQWLAAQYAAGTPVTIYYPLATPVEENYTQN